MRLLKLLLVIGLANCIWATTPEPPAPRARVLDTEWIERYATTGRFQQGAPKHPRFAPDGTAVFFLQSSATDRAQSLMRLSLTDGTVETLLTPEQVLGDEPEVLSEAELGRRERTRSQARGITSFELSSEGDFAVLPLSGSLYLLRLDGDSEPQIARLPAPDGPSIVDPHLSPNDLHVAYVRGSDLYVYDLSARRERRIVAVREEGVSVGSAEFIAQEEMRRTRGFWWSPDSRQLAFQRTDERGVELLRRESLLGGASVEQRYPRPGRQNANVTLETVSVWGGATSKVKWDNSAYPYLTAVRWSVDAPLTLVVQDRAQHNLVVLVADERGETRELHRESDPAWINLDPDMPVWLPDGRGFLWSSERDGNWQLELRTAAGELERVLVPMNVGYRSFVGMDAEGTSAVVDAGQIPSRQAVIRVRLDTDGLEELQSATAFNHGMRVGPSGAVVIRSESLTTRPVFRVLSSAGERLLPARTAESGLRLTTRIQKLGEDRSFYTAWTLPSDAEPGERFPGLFYVYAGPTSVTIEERESAFLLDQWLADSGFVVFRIDGRGTTRRGRDWNRAVRNDFLTTPLADHIEALELLAERVPELDTSRVGIFGWSFGGYAAAMAVMRAPEVFHAAVAGAPVVDWADYDTYYTERYLGVPEEVSIDEAYQVSDVTRYAPLLDRPLMVLHGVSDDNVFFRHALKLSDSLTRAGRPHAIVPLSGQAHGVSDVQLVAGMYTTIVNFLKSSLAQPKPVESQDEREARAILVDVERN